MKIIKLIIVCFISFFIFNFTFLPLLCVAQEGYSKEESEMFTKEEPSSKTSAEKEKGITEGKKEPAGESVIRIKEVGEKKKGKKLYSMEFRSVNLKDLLRIFAHDYNLNIIMDKDIEGKVTLSFQKVTLQQALDSILSTRGYTFEKKGNILEVKKNLITKTFQLKSIEAKQLLSQKGKSGKSKAAGTASTTQAASAEGTAQGAGQKVGAGGKKVKRLSTIFNLLSDEGKIFLGKKPNSIMVKDYPENVKAIGEYISMVDKKMKTEVIELKYIQAKDLLEVETTSGEESTSSDTSGGSSSEEESSGGEY